MYKIDYKKFSSFALITTVIISTGIFYWNWNNQKDVKALNEMLPSGVSIAKTITNDYKIKNNVDDYEFKVPREWAGISEIIYTPERAENGYNVATVELAGNNGPSIILVVNQFKLADDEKELIEWAENNFNNFDLVGNFSGDNVNGIEIIKTTEEVHLLGMWVYFFRTEEFVYAITNGSEDYIKYIVANGKW